MRTLDAVFAGDNDRRLVVPPSPLDDPWHFSVSLPGWIPWMKGDAGARVDGIKKEVSRKIARTLESKLDKTVARTDDWFDPYIGLRAHYKLSAAFYLTGKGDIGGFGVGSDLTWTGEAALGCQLARNLFAEAGYRALGVNYDRDGLLLDTITHGPQITLGITF